MQITKWVTTILVLLLLGVLGTGLGVAAHHLWDHGQIPVIENRETSELPRHRDDSAVGAGEEKTIVLQTPSGSIAFAADSKQLFVGSSNGNIKLWDLEATPPREVAELKGHTRTIHGLAVSSDGQWLASTAGQVDNSVRIWAIKGAETKERHHLRMNGAGYVQFSPKGNLLAVASNELPLVRVYDAQDGKTRADLAHKEAVDAVGFAPDGILATAGAEGILRLWDLTPATPTERAKVRLGDRWLWHAAFSPDNKSLVVGCGADKTKRLYAFDQGDLKLKELWREEGFARVMFHPTVNQCAYAIKKRLSLRSAETGAELNGWNLDEPVTGVEVPLAFSPNGKLLAVPTGKNKVLVVRLTVPRPR